MKAEIKVIKVKLDGNTLTIDLAKELSINENLLNSQLKESPSSYYIFCKLRDNYIKKRDTLEREKEEAYSKAWTYYKASNERFSNEHVSHLANSNNKYCSLCRQYIKVSSKANMFISICKAYENRENILRTLSATLRKQQ